MEGVVYSTRLPDPRSGKEAVVMEVWIEKLSICINELDGAYASTSPHSAINHFGTFNLPESFCALVKEYVAKKAAFDEGNTRLFAVLKARLAPKKSQHNKIV